MTSKSAANPSARGRPSSCCSARPTGTRPNFPIRTGSTFAASTNKHVAFGWGIHFWLGAPLARLMGEVALNTVLRRLPEIRFADRGFSQDPPWREAVGLRMLKSLPVVF